MRSAENATIAKARAIYGKRLKYNDYVELASKKQVAEAAEYLKKNTYFSEELSNIDTSSIHRGFLESLIDKAYYSRYERLCRFQHLDSQPFYNFLLVRSEIRELLKALLYLNNDNKDAYIETMQPYLVGKSSFDLMELANAYDFKAVLNVLRHTPYYDVLKNVGTDSKGNIPYTECEVRLRTYHLKWLIEKGSECVGGKSKKALIDQINVQTDIINIINAYRMKKYFNSDADTLKKYTLPFYGRLSAKMQSDLFQTESSEEYLRMLSHTSYGRKMEQLSVDMESSQFEKELVKIRYAMAKRALMFSESAAVSLYSLMYLEEVEMNNIINIIEGIRYEKSMSYMENLIVL
ncbi:MAG: V-type ATPase subunit [Clostridium sp.]|nr:V-type ATPase subunit [Clostridium sp.]